jgi:hypothetical protein
MSPAERRHLGRWTSASLRDPRRGRAVEEARSQAATVIERDVDRRRRWRAAAGPLHDGLARGASEARRWRIVMLATHLAAVVAITAIPGGLSALVAAVVVVAAPVSAIAAWGRGLEWLGAINQALAIAAEDRLSDAEDAALRRAWVGAVETPPPSPPPMVGAIGALAPSALLVIALVAVALAKGPG